MSGHCTFFFSSLLAAFAEIEGTSWTSFQWGGVRGRGCGCNIFAQFLGATAVEMSWMQQSFCYFLNWISFFGFPLLLECILVLRFLHC